VQDPGCAGLGVESEAAVMDGGQVLAVVGVRERVHGQSLGLSHCDKDSADESRSGSRVRARYAWKADC
jgi:hypothetical protein